GGAIARRIDPEALAHLAVGRPVALVSGTNGKTTTTALLAALARRQGPVVTNRAGANLHNGLVATLLGAPADRRAVLEVDEAALPSVITSTRPQVVALLNLSRDQLDRLHEVRHTADRWRVALESSPSVAVVANADDPLVVWAAETSEVTWVACGQHWHLDATTCPHCSSALERAGAWRCTGCDWRRPDVDYALDTDGSQPMLRRIRDDHTWPLDLPLPGRFNLANAALALAAADTMGLAGDDPSAAWQEVQAVSDRYRVVDRDGTAYRLLLAKNPAGWAEMLTLLEGSDRPAILALNARGQDGVDPSWIWDVPFELLAGRRVICTGERASDLAVRLTYAGVDHQWAGDLDAAIALAAGWGDVDLVANYTAFQQARRIFGVTHA
ncbi:MAG TPA: MurT ligase domain-containing protein, partial [Acidimicrobiales bacterium]|nr:MurT ligase domain-containing protein [Acidimicrobiales bacterium]